MKFSWIMFRTLVIENPGWVLAAIIVPTVIIYEVRNSFMAREARIEYEITTNQKLPYDSRGVSIFFDPPGSAKNSGVGTHVSVNNKPTNTGVFRYTQNYLVRKSFWVQIAGPFKIKMRYFFDNHYCGEYAIDVKNDKQIEKEVEFCQGVRFN